MSNECYVINIDEEVNVGEFPLQGEQGEQGRGYRASLFETPVDSVGEPIAFIHGLTVYLFYQVEEVCWCPNAV